MNKKNMILAVGLMFSVATTALPIYEQEREVLYAMHTIGQDFADAGFVKQNVDMFISIFQMNSQLLEKKLAVANQKAKKALLTNGALIAGATLAKIVTNTSLAYVLDQIYMSSSCTTYRAFADNISILIDKTTFGLLGVGKIYAAVSLFDVFKERSALKEALAIDQEILEQLEAIKDLAMFSIDGDLPADLSDEALPVLHSFSVGGAKSEALAEADVAEDAADGSDAEVLEVAELE